MQLSTAGLGRQSQIGSTVFPILLMISLVHLFNDTIQAVVPAIFPILKDTMHLSYSQLGIIAFMLNATASLMQPAVGVYTDKKPSPLLLPLGMASTLFGVLTLAFAPNFWVTLLSVMLIGIGSAVFHPEGSRVAHMASGGRKGLAQSIFQVGGNAGQSLAPVMTALIFVPLGQIGSAWFTLVAGAAVIVLMFVAAWYRQRLRVSPRTVRASAAVVFTPEHKRKIRNAMLLLIFFVFARSWYYAGIASFYPFYLNESYGITIKDAQTYIFAFLLSGAVGTFFGGPLSDKFGKRNIMLFSMLGAAPLSLLLPYVSLPFAFAICLINGFILLSSFSVMVVYAQELVPGKVGTVSGLITGLAFGIGGIGSATLGLFADHIGLHFVMLFCSLLPFVGLVAFFLPSDKKMRQWNEAAMAQGVPRQG